MRDADTSAPQDEVAARLCREARHKLSQDDVPAEDRARLAVYVPLLCVPEEPPAGERLDNSTTATARPLDAVRDLLLGQRGWQQPGSSQAEGEDGAAPPAALRSASGGPRQTKPVIALQVYPCLAARPAR